MKLFVPITAMAALFASAKACQCVSSVGPDAFATRNCCGHAGGNPNGDQCEAHQISGRFGDFHSCCTKYGAESDCRCYKGCKRAELRAQRKRDAKDSLADYEALADEDESSVDKGKVTE